MDAPRSAAASSMLEGEQVKFFIGPLDCDCDCDCLLLVLVLVLVLVLLALLLIVHDDSIVGWVSGFQYTTYYLSTC